MDIVLLGDTLQMFGEVLIGYTAIRVHFRVWKEHSIDEKVFNIMKRERYLGILGIIAIIAGFLVRNFLA